MNFTEVFNKTVDKYRLIGEGDSVLIGLSGGPDSVALLSLLTKIRKKMNLRLTAVYINHQIRPKAALKEEKFCQELCDRMGLELDIVTEDIPALAKKKKTGLEETAREFRYEVYELLADEDGHDKIALGHHIDDRVETVLFRILRGTGSAGLKGIPVKRGKYIRPLYALTKNDILAYLRKNELDYCLDESNLRADFSRNFIRNELLPEIRDKLNPGVDRAILNLSENIAAEEEYLEQIAEKTVKKAINITSGGKLEVDLILFKGYDLWLKRRLLRYGLRFLSLRQLAPDKEVIDRLVKLEKKSISLPEKIQAIITDKKLVLYRRGKPAVYNIRLEYDQLLKLDNLKLNFKCRQNRVEAVNLKNKKQSRKVFLDSNRIALPLTVRNIEPGDRFQPLGLSGTKKIGDFLTDRKIPAVYRDEIPVICDKQGIIWLVGYEIADRVKVDHKTKKVMSIEVSTRK